jgi:hypothetical protein
MAKSPLHIMSRPINTSYCRFAPITGTFDITTLLGNINLHNIRYELSIQTECTLYFRYTISKFKSFAICSVIAEPVAPVSQRACFLFKHFLSSYSVLQIPISLINLSDNCLHLPVKQYPFVVLFILLEQN